MKTRQVAIRLDEELAKRIERYQAVASKRSKGVKVRFSTAMRMLIVKGLDAS